MRAPPPQHRLPSRRADLRRQPFPAPPEPGCSLSSPQGGRAQPLAPSQQARKPHGTFKEYEVDFIRVDIKHLPKLKDSDRVLRLYVAIDRASRYVHVAVKDDETTASATAFLADALGAFLIQVTPVPTDRSPYFTADAFEVACERHSVQHRKTRPYTPKTNGMIERFNGRVQREVLGIALYDHSDLEVVLRGFNAAYNSRRQRVLNGLSLEMIPRQRLEAEPALASPTYKPPSRTIIKQAPQVVADA